MGAMTTPEPRRFPPAPIRDVHVRHVKQSCAPRFAEISLDFEPADDGFTFEVAEDLEADYATSEDPSPLFAAVAAGAGEQLGLPEHAFVPATRVVLRRIRTREFGARQLAFKIAGYLAAEQAVERAAWR